MNNLFIDSIQIIVDGNQSEVLKIGSGGTYNPNRVKNMAIEKVKSKYPNSKLAAKIIFHNKVTLDEYQKELGDQPSWAI